MRYLLALGMAIGLLPGLAAGSPSVSAGGSGSAIVVPYYSVHNDWRTLLNLSNLSENSLVVMVSLHEARNGRPVMRFRLALNPFEMWAGWLSMGSDGRPIIRTGQASCTAPLAVRDTGLSADERAYSSFPIIGIPPNAPKPFRDNSETDGDLTRMAEGHIEILVMGEVRNVVAGTTPWFAGHDDGQPRDCPAFAAAFELGDGMVWDGEGVIPGESGSGNPPARSDYDPILSRAPLKANVSLVHAARGLAAGVDPLHIDGWGRGRNLVTADAYPWYAEPTLASHHGLWTTGGLQALHDYLSATSVTNEWAANPATGAGTDWVLTFPTKRFQTDENAENVMAACSRWRNVQASGGVPAGEAGNVFFGWSETSGLVPHELVADAGVSPAQRLCPKLGFWGIFQEGNDGRADVAVRYVLAPRMGPRETVAIEGGWSLSAPPPPAFDGDAPPYVVNVLEIGRTPAEGPAVLDSLIGQTIGSQWPSWHSPRPLNGLFRVLPRYFSDATDVGLPVTGFVAKVRDFGDPTRNYLQANEHAYVYPADGPFPY